MPLGHLSGMPAIAVVLAATLALSMDAQDARTVASLKAAAEAGDARAQLDYAKAIKNKPESRTWALKAAEQGLADAWFWLGYTAPGDAALPFYEKAAEGGYARAFSYVIDGLLLRAGEKADVAKAKKFADLARRLQATDVDDDALTVVDRCAEAGRPEVPLADRPSAAEVKAFAGVDCDFILEGVGQPPDPVRYGRCVLADAPIDRHKAAEVYANGLGVTRNAMTAIAFLCHSSDVPAELEAMVAVLYATRTAARLDEPFWFCNHVMSGLNQGNCALRQEAMDEARRDAAIATLTTGWPPAHKAAFTKLWSAAEEFFTARAGAEFDMSGTARVAIAVDEAGHLRQELTDQIHAFEAGTLPAPMVFKTADTELNAVYSQLMKKKVLGLGTVTTDDIRRTQKTWLAYRDAWGAFGALRYPARSAENWRAWATARRVDQLKELLGK